MNRAIYKMNFSCGRQGYLEGIFVAGVKEMEDLIESEKEIYFGEVLGKHSEVYGPIEEEDIDLVTTDPDFIKIFEEYGLSTGYNPFDYIYEDK